MELIKELFVEILISGILFVFGISPILIRCSPSVWPKKGLLPKLGEWDEWKPWVIIAIALVYATGVAGNRFVEVLYHEWIGFQATITVKQDNQEKVFKSHEVEFAARNHGVISRDWVERHKTYRKVLRAASFSSLLFVFHVLLSYSAEYAAEMA